MEAIVEHDPAAWHDTLDRFEAVLAQGEPVEMPVGHYFIPGFYCRQIRMPAGAVLTSKMHNTQHAYCLSRGVVAVSIDGDHTDIIRAPHSGITEPGTRRALFVLEDAVWTTFHPTEETDVERIEAQIIEDRTNPLLPESAQYSLSHRRQSCLGSQ